MICGLTENSQAKMLKFDFFSVVLVRALRHVDSQAILYPFLYILRKKIRPNITDSSATYGQILKLLLFCFALRLSLPIGNDQLFFSTIPSRLQSIFCGLFELDFSFFFQYLPCTSSAPCR